MLRWDEIDTVLLDMDGTLLDLHYDNFCWQEYLPAKWGERHGLDANAAKARLLPRMQSREGTLSWYCIDYWSREFGLDMFELHRNLDHLIRLRPGAEDLLEHLRALDKSVALVTNSHQRLLLHKLARTGIARHFDAIVSSHSLGVPKEDAGFWHGLRARLRYDPERTLLIDDSPAVLRAAQEHGLRWLLAVARPDSRRPPRAAVEFPALETFQPLLSQARAKHSSHAG